METTAQTINLQLVTALHGGGVNLLIINRLAYQTVLSLHHVSSVPRARSPGDGFFLWPSWHDSPTILDNILKNNQLKLITQ